MALAHQRKNSFRQTQKATQRCRETSTATVWTRVNMSVLTEWTKRWAKAKLVRHDFHLSIFLSNFIVVNHILLAYFHVKNHLDLV